MERRLKVGFDPARCVGHGRCYDLAPELFDEDDEGRCVVIARDVPASLQDKARVAVENCPEDAIWVEDENA